MNKRVLRIYLDTSVFGGCFDIEFAKESNLLISQIESGLFELVVSETTIRELALAPEQVRKLLQKVESRTVFLEATEQITQLKEAYLAAGILPAECWADAEHIASATIAEADMIVSWNFKHIVNFRKIKGFQGVNLQFGFKPIDIFSPREVVYDRE